MEEQKGINVQLAQRIDTVESTLNKRIDGLESNLNQKIDNLQYSITKINNLLEVQERGRFPSQTLPNPKGVHEVGSSSNSGMDEVKAIITLRSGREIEQPVPMTVEETCKENEAELERVIIGEDLVKYYYKLVICDKIIQKWVSIFETNECDIRILDIHRFPRVDGLSTGPPG